MTKPTDCIPVADAKALQANWNSNQAIDIQNVRGTQDVIAVTFNIDQLQEYIDYVKAESKKQGFNDPGIRVYFAAKSASNGGNATTFFCPTENDGGNSNNNYNLLPLNRGNGGYPPSAY